MKGRSLILLILKDAGCHFAHFDRVPFAFAHRFHISDHFSLDALRDLAIRIGPKQNRWYVEKEIPPNGWGTPFTADRLKRVLRTLAIIARW